MNLKRSAVIAAAFLVVISLTLSACQTAVTEEEAQATVQSAIDSTMAAMPTLTTIPSATSTPLPTPTATSIPVQYGPTDFPDNVNPLTGLTVSDPSILDRRPVLVKVSNFPREGRPHAGLSSADIVFNYSTGQGTNRFLALFYGQDSDQVGPIRSGRYVDRWLVSMYQGIIGMMYAWAPEMTEIYNVLGYSRVLQGGPNSCPYICDEDLGISEISWFANTAEMTKQYEGYQDALKTKPDLEGMAFNTYAPEGGAAATEFTMHFGLMNESLWKYDPSSKKYLGWIDNKLSESNYEMIPWVDRNNDQQLAFSNIIVIFTTYTTYNADDTEIEISMVGTSGKMLLFRDGQEYQGTWKGVAYNSPILFYDSNKEIIELQPGNTFICIVGNNSLVTNDTTGIWKVQFGKP